MPPKKNPLGLNALQLKTLTLLQELARVTGNSGSTEEAGIAVRPPDPYGDHFHLGDAVIAMRDASGLRNSAVWAVLERKGLIRSMYPHVAIVTPLGLDYDTGLREAVLRKSGH